MRGQKLKRDVIVNIFFVGIKVVALLWVVRLAGIVFLPVTLGLFLLSRRLSSTWANLFQLGMSQTLLRHVSMHTNEAQRKRDFILVALFAWLMLVIIFIPLFYLGRVLLATWLFPNTPSNAALTFWTCTSILSLVIGFIAYSILLAERRMTRANLVELMNVGGFLLLAFVLGGENITPAGVIQFQAIATVSLSLGTIVIYLSRLKDVSWFAGFDWRSTAQVFIKYGFPRGGITFLDMAILLVGPWLLRAEIDEAGYLIIALTLVRIIQTAINPIVQVASIVTAHFVGRQDEESITEGVQLLFGTILYATLLTMAIFIPWMEYLVNLWLTDTTLVASVLPYFSILLWGILPFTIFHGLKGIIEMRWHHPFNFYTLLLGLGVQAVLYQLTVSSLGAVLAIRLAVLASFWGMGLLTLVWVKSYLRPLNYLGINRLAFVTIILALLNIGLKVTIGLSGAPIALLLSAGIIFIFFLYLSPTPFTRSFQTFVLSRNV